MTMVRYFKIHYWPGVTCAWFLFTFVVSYLVSVLGGNVYAYFPYISDTGALPPESCIFGQFLNIGAVLMAVCMYIRYCQVDIAINAKEIDLHERWNTVAIVFGSMACLGLSIVANFQETAASGMHLIGAVLAYGIGTFYFYLQTRISFAYRNRKNSSSVYRIGKSLLYLRVFLVIWFMPLFLSNIICASLSIEQFTGESIVWWTEEDGGFQLRLAGSFTEWILTVFMFVYIATFTKEFKTLIYKGIQFEAKNSNIQRNGIQMKGTTVYS